MVGIVSIYKVGLSIWVVEDKAGIGVANYNGPMTPTSRFGDRAFM